MNGKPRGIEQQIPDRETCMNPFHGKLCLRENIAVTIQYKGQLLPICRDCWEILGNSDHEWGSKNG